MQTINIHQSKRTNIERLIKLDSNELPYTHDPAVRLSLENYCDHIRYYPEGDGDQLKENIAQLNHVTLNNVLITAGSSEAISLATATFCDTDDAVITFKHAFQFYQMCVQQQRKSIHLVHETENWGQDLYSVLKGISSKTKLIFITNPSNPLGTWISEDRLVDFLKKVPTHITVVVDEAYFEFMDTEPSYRSAVGYINEYPNLLVIRTFSKLYGLAGLRIGYMLGHSKLIDALATNKPPFSVNCVAIRCALQALDSRDYYQHCKNQMIQSRHWLYEQLTQLGFPPLANSANFLTFKYGPRAIYMVNLLKTKNILVKELSNYGLTEFVRVSIGTDDELQIFLDHFRDL